MFNPYNPHELAEYVEHYRWERNHQGIENERLQQVLRSDYG
jgi:hypothetical protein